MGRKKAKKKKFDFEKEAIKLIELLAGQELPEEKWKWKYFIDDAKDRFLGFEDKIESMEGEMDELRSVLFGVKEKADDLLEQTTETVNEIRDLTKEVLKDG